jgi:hypothetical protein
MPAKLKSRLFWLALNVVVLVIVFNAWQPPRADAFLRTPTVLNSTWYGPALLLLLPVLMYWVSLAVTIRSIRIIGCVVFAAAFLVGIFVVIDSRQTPGFPLNPNAGVVQPLRDEDFLYEAGAAAFATAERKGLASFR